MQVNEDIDFPEVRVIGPTGEMLGMMSSKKALDLAYNMGLDLVLMSADSKPPVCKIIDYGKFRFERDKREKEAKKKQQIILYGRLTPYGGNNIIWIDYLNPMLIKRQ